MTEPASWDLIPTPDDRKAKKLAAKLKTQGGYEKMAEALIPLIAKAVNDITPELVEISFGTIQKDLKQKGMKLVADDFPALVDAVNKGLQTQGRWKAVVAGSAPNAWMRLEAVATR